MAPKKKNNQSAKEDTNQQTNSTQDSSQSPDSI